MMQISTIGFPHILGAETFAGRKFRKKKKIAKLRALTFANDALSGKFRNKNFRDREKDAFSREKTFATEEK